MVLGGLSLLQTGVRGLKSLQSQTQTFTHPIIPKISPKKNSRLQELLLCPRERMEVRTETRPSTRGRFESDTWHSHPAGAHRMEQRQPVKTVQVGALSEKRKGRVHKGERTKSPQEPSSFLQSNLQAPQSQPYAHLSVVGVGGVGGQSYC